jgi:hypothetical protein
VDDQGVRHDDRETMGSMVKEYFVNLFHVEVQEMDDSVLNDVQWSDTEGMNQMLLDPFSHEEVKWHYLILAI